MRQLEASLKFEGETTLSATYHTDHRLPIIVFWNGTTDKDITRFHLKIKLILNITSYSDNNDSNFNLKLDDVTGTNKIVIFRRNRLPQKEWEDVKPYGNTQLNM